MKKAQWKTLGVEPSEETREHSVEKFGLKVLPEEDLKMLPESGFDVITMWHVLEHVPDLNARLEDLKRLIKKDGIIIIAVPNPESKDAEIYQELWAAYDVPRHLYHFSPGDIERLFKNHGMKVQRILPMIFDSFYVSMLSEKNKTGKTNIIRSTWNGLVSNLAAMNSGKKYSSQIYIITLK